MSDTVIYAGGQLGEYNFGADHPFGPSRHDAFFDEFRRRKLEARCDVAAPVLADREAIARFHTSDYIDRVERASVDGQGLLDAGDTPAFPGVMEASARVVGTVLKAVDDIVTGNCDRAFVPIAGLHHARRDSAAGFCVFNDCGVAIETLRRVHGIRRVAYVDIDAHHGDGVFYAFEDDQDLIFVDLHEDGRYLYPGTGSVTETGRGEAKGTKLNVPLPPKADDAVFFKAWEVAESFIDRAQPDFILFQCGADSLAGDPITHLKYSSAAHRHAASRLSSMAQRHCDGRLLALGGGGYNLQNLAVAWCAVVEAFIEAA
ncbi:MAG: acetoin utilization protein AcuC [endosymbiont of Seepiophila jonesi]|uniref:Acetoin utilization protein AcuC n=1 Tax=endosymbiont of Lamellibrachia luymesi TaxID=2200907 RepID=A0A370DVS7_9GAMM|nr:MAG: acetoin utilization protein AcuC [endosymbiont of Lamellibrachia luymesi]RDH89012.1 MAG: acetoin utilization protein AcuC [endosymbiont of Seepiophila jonesi]